MRLVIPTGAPQEESLTYYAIERGLFFPTYDNLYLLSNALAMNTAGQKTAHIGRLYIEGRAASATFSAAGGGEISTRLNTVTWANTSSNLVVGIQGVTTGAGPIARPDESFTVSRIFVGSTDPITTNSWNTFSMTGGSGSSTLNHGQLIAVVFDLTAVAGGDTMTTSVINSTVYNTTGAGQTPTTNVYTGGAWQTTQTSGAGRCPNVLIKFDGGLYGILDSPIPLSASSNESFSSGTNPKERGLAFKLPWSCKIDALWFSGYPTDANADYTITLYSVPFSATPTEIVSVSVSAETLGIASAGGPHIITLPSEYSLTRDTEYVVAVLATGSTGIRINNFTAGNTEVRRLIPGGTTVYKAYRNDTNTFVAEDPKVTLYPIGVRISQLQS